MRGALQQSVDFDIQYVGKSRARCSPGEAVSRNAEGPGRIWLQSLPLSRLANRIIASAPAAGGKARGEGSLLGGLGGILMATLGPVLDPVKARLFGLALRQPARMQCCGSQVLPCDPGARGAQNVPLPPCNKGNRQRHSGLAFHGPTREHVRRQVHEPAAIAALHAGGSACGLPQMAALRASSDAREPAARLP